MWESFQLLQLFMEFYLLIDELYCVEMKVFGKNLSFTETAFKVRKIGEYSE